MLKLSGGLEFLHTFGAKRAGAYGDGADFFGVASGPPDEGESGPVKVPVTPLCNWNYETENGIWDCVSVRRAPPLDPADPLTPCRFVDGKDVGRVVAYVASPAGFPVPIRLSQVGAVALRAVPPSVAGEQTVLRVESRRVENVVSFMADLFPWDEVERFAAGLQASGFRLLIARRLDENDDPRDIAFLQNGTKTRTREEMFRLERRAAAAASDGAGGPVPVTLADGRLDDKEEIVRGVAPFIGLIKTHSSTSYLHEEGWNTLYALRTGDRTPVIGLQTAKLDLVTWYVRLCEGVGGGEGGPFDGVVRVEISRAFFENTAGKDWTYIDRLSRALCVWRTRDAGYGRAGVTLHPIQQAEDRLGALFLPPSLLTARFYKMSGL